MHLGDHEVASQVLKKLKEERAWDIDWKKLVKMLESLGIIKESKK